MTEQKPREFWIVNDYACPSTFNDEEDAKSYCECASLRDEYGYDVIHVIEKSAYDSLKSQLDEANEMIAELEKALEFYADEDNWLNPDNYVPYWTLWDNGDNIGFHKARETIAKLKEWRGK